jgi:hypothetical protein
MLGLQCDLLPVDSPGQVTPLRALAFQNTTELFWLLGEQVSSGAWILRAKQWPGTTERPIITPQRQP